MVQFISSKLLWIEIRVEADNHEEFKEGVEKLDAFKEWLKRPDTPMPDRNPIGGVREWVGGFRESDANKVYTKLIELGMQQAVL